MSQFFQPLKKIPQQIHNLQIFQKLQDLKSGRHSEQIHCHKASLYGMLNSPVGFSFDQDLDLLAIAYSTGKLSIYGAPGITFPVEYFAKGLSKVEFLRNEGRVIVSTSENSIVLIELNVATGIWYKKCSVELPFIPNEYVTAMCVGEGIIYVGSNLGSLRQIAVHGGRISLGADELTSLTIHMITNSLREECQTSIKQAPAIVSIDYNMAGRQLAIAYAGGVAVVAGLATELSKEVEATEATVSVADTDTRSEPALMTEEAVEEEHPLVMTETPDRKPETPEKKPTHQTSVKDEAMRKLRSLTKTFRTTLKDRHHAVEANLPVPPPPQVTHILQHSQVVEFASWRVSRLDSVSCDVIVAYSDGAHITWPIDAGQPQNQGPLVLANREVASVPYGPLPCCPIKKIMVRLSTSGEVMTVFIGGLPRAEHSGKHTVTVMGSGDEHVCFHFGAAVRDFLILPPSPRTQLTDQGEVTCLSAGPTPTEAGYLLVLTEHELVAIDLSQPSWPVLPSPYLGCIDCSGITALSHIALPDELASRFYSTLGLTSTSYDWPIQGCKVTSGDVAPIDLSHNPDNDLIVIGHADGYVSLWALGRGNCVLSFGRIHSNGLFDVYGLIHKGCFAEEAWPPFRPVGACLGVGSPPDCRLAVTALSLHLLPGSRQELAIVVAGGAGQVSVWSSHAQTSEFEPDLARLYVDLLPQPEQETPFLWEGLDTLKPIEGYFRPSPTDSSMFHPQHLIQLYPPAPITAVKAEPTWNLLAIGSAHGFAVVDTQSRASVYRHFTRDDSSSPHIAPVSAFVKRSRDLKSSLRQSFRRLKKPKTQHATEAEVKSPDAAVASLSEDALESAAGAVVASVISSAAGVEPGVVASTEDADLLPSPPTSEEVTAQVSSGAGEVSSAAGVEPGVVASSEDADLLPSPPTSEEVTAQVSSGADVEPVLCEEVVQLKLSASERGPGLVACFAFLEALIQAPTSLPCLFVGTRCGALLIHSITWPLDQPVSLLLVKRLQLRHAAPILGVALINAANYAPLKPEHKPSGDVEGVAASREADEPVVEVAAPPEECPPAPDAETQLLVVCSETQVKLISLPQLRSLHKYRIWEKTSSQKQTAKALAASVDEQKASQESGELEEVEQPPTAQVTATPASEFGQQASAHAQPIEQVMSRRIAAFSLQALPRKQQQLSQEWCLVLAMTNGCLMILALPSLRRTLKTYCIAGQDTTIDSLLTPSVSDCANLIFWPLSTGQVIASEVFVLAPQRLSSPILSVGPVGPEHEIRLPSWARTAAAAVAAAKTVHSEAIPADQKACTEEEALADESSAGDKMGAFANGLPTTGGDETPFKAMNDSLDESAQLHADMTEDSIRDYIQEGATAVAVTTTESLFERHTIMDDGILTTTVHEKEVIDEEVIKDELVQTKITTPLLSEALTGGA